MARLAALEQVTLAEQYGDCDPLDQFPAGVMPSLDVGDAAVRDLGPEHVECVIGFYFDLTAPRDQEMLCDISASFRLVYRMKPLRTEAARRDWAATRAVVDAWPYWRAYLTSTMTSMGLQPLHLSPEPPAELEAGTREAFDITRRAEQKAEAKATKRSGKKD